jgi:hypothetical protein
MTTNEKQELNVLKIFVDNNIEEFSAMKFPEALNNALGTGAHAIVVNLIRDGMVADLHTGIYAFSETGQKRYALLKSQNRSDTIAFWIPIVISLIALGVALYSVYLQTIPITK